MPAPLVQATVIAVIKEQLSAMTFEDPQTHAQFHPTGPMIEQLSQAMGKALFKILKEQVLIGTNPGQPVQVSTGSGTGTTIGPGTGVIQ